MVRHRFFILAGLVGLVILVAVNFGYITEFVNLLEQVHWAVFGAVIVIQGLSFYANTKYYQSFLAIIGYTLPTARLYRAALAINFVNQAFPSGGVSGASFLAKMLEPEVPHGKATLTQLARYVFTYVSFLAVLGTGFLLLFWGGNISRVTVRLMLLFLLLVITGSLILAVIVGDRAKLERVAAGLSRVINRIMTAVRRRPSKFLPPQRQRDFFDEFYDGYRILLAEKGRFRRPLFYTLMGNVMEVATVYAIFLVFGHVLNPGTAITGYMLANLASLAAVVTSGVGVYEAAMVTTFAALGVPFALAVSVTIVYRMLNFSLFLPLGFYYYRQSIRDRVE